MIDVTCNIDTSMSEHYHAMQYMLKSTQTINWLTVLGTSVRLGVCKGTKRQLNYETFKRLSVFTTLQRLSDFETLKRLSDFKMSKDTVS